MNVKRIAVGLAMVAGALALGERAVYADFCLATDNGVGYQLQLGTATPNNGTPIVVTGTRVVNAIRRPVFGSLIITGSVALLSIEEVFDFGSGIWSNPNGTTMFTIPLSPGGQTTFDTTFHGNGAPINVKGGVSNTACPLAESASTASTTRDPNAR